MTLQCLPEVLPQNWSGCHAWYLCSCYIRGVGAGGAGGGYSPPQYSDVLYSYHIHITNSAPSIIMTLIRHCIFIMICTSYN